MKSKSNNIKSISFTASFIIFFSFGTLFTFYNHFLIPHLVDKVEINPFIVVQLVNTFLLNIPIFSTTLILVKAEGLKLNWKNVKERLNFRKIYAQGVYLIFISLVVAVVLVIAIYFILMFLPFFSFSLGDLRNIVPIHLEPLRGSERLFVLFMPFSFFLITWEKRCFGGGIFILGKKKYLVKILGLLTG